jgi:hypothetical protein
MFYSLCIVKGEEDLPANLNEPSQSRSKAKQGMTKSYKWAYYE